MSFETKTFIFFFCRALKKNLTNCKNIYETGFLKQLTISACQNLWFKGAVSQDFLPFLLIEPIWAPDEQAKIVFLKNSFLRRYSNLKFEKFDSAQANIAQSQFF